MAWTPPRVSEFRDRIRVERRSIEADEYGNTQGSWVNVATGIPAAIWVTRGGESVQAARLEGGGAVDVTVRNNSTTAPILISDRLVNERTGESYNVGWKGSLDVERRFLVLTCKTGGAD